MPERIREVNIIVVIETNKATYEETFSDIQEAEVCLKEMIEDIC